MPTSDSSSERRTHALLLIDPSSRADRSLRTGVLHYFGRQARWDIRVEEHIPPLAPRALRQFIRSWPVDGLIAAPACERSARLALRSIPVPQRPVLILIDPERPFGADGVLAVDDVSIGRCAAEFFLKRGYCHTAYVGSALPSECAHSNCRERHFSETVCRGGATCDIFRGQDQDAAQELTEVEDLKAFFLHLPKPAGVFAYCDSRARQVYAACHQAGIRIPEQIAVLGVDNDAELCEALVPTLSSIIPDFYQSGARAAWMLSQICTAERHPAHPLVQQYRATSIQERASSCDVRGTGRIAAAAHAYIHAHLRERISVAAIACDLNISCRLLELRFREVYGRSLIDEIVNERLNLLTDRLLHSSASLDTLAHECGFRTAANMCLLFRRHRGCTIRAWQKNQKLFPPRS